MMKFEEIVRSGNITMGEAVAEAGKIIDAKVEADEEMFIEIMESVSYDIFKVLREDETIYEDWSKIPNRVVMTKGFLSLFEDTVTAYLVVYTGLQLMMECFKNGRSPYLQIFSYKGTTYWIIREEHGVTVLLPNEY